ncbi:S-layer family protein [Janthinobacterium sp. GW458P]|uniref:beta strand repeat-containing protein n=1 Tax=Janthinobacterium sp. GW458P TaxID=1981504 RepID=UPI000A329111|nr:filamentous hemagglutinin N-terminal domain-containing protein [Janthinobacterium sp. GW458P]MBE3023154.1 filamentous hemagglutinin N-terminal domain-containing protein [Janthinobacterium sp. GW458P]
MHNNAPFSALPLPPCGPPLRRTALALLLAGCFGAAQANPALPQVVNGQATFNQQGNVFSITNTPNTIINWQSFSIHAGEITRFIQQNGNSAVLNRITGQDPSKILGSLESNGKVFLINPNGIVFGHGARVDVNGLVASSLGMSNEDFLAGKRQFTAGGAAGGVSNAGVINAGKGGQVLLIAPNVENTGVITAPNGEVILSAGRSVQLADPGNPELRVLVSAPADQALNLGQIIAQGGSIGMAGALVSQRGVLNANSAVMGENGKIVLKASGKALLEAGSITSATGAAGKGGEIRVLGDQVGLQGNARVDASGATGGGTVLLGGDYQGKNAAVQNARQVLVGKDASVNADAIVSGNGGKVIAWGNESAQVHGSISARGGAQGGDGGFVETSGHYLAVDGIRVNTSAARGKRGNWLLDPYDIDVVQGAGGSLANVDQFSDMPSSGSTSIGADTISGATSDVTLQALHRINFSSSVNMLNSGVSLTAQAGETINVYAAITTNGGNVTLSANDPASTGGNYGLGSNVNLNAAITSNGGNISLSGASIEGAATVHVGNGNLSLRANDALGGINLSGGASQLAGSGIAGQTVTLQADNITVAGGIDVGGTAGGANVIIKPLSSARSIDLGTKSGTALSLNAVELAGISAASLTIGDGTNTGGLRISDALARTGDLHLNSGSAITATGAVTVGGSFVLDGGVWVQNAAALPGFSARNFTIGSGASFLRVAGGDGAATPYLLADIYGLQGIASLGLGNSYRLAGNIDASGTANWNDGQGFVPIAGSGIGFSGVFDGGGFTLSNLKIDRSLVPGPAAGLFGTVQGGTLRNLTLSGGSVTGRANVGALAGEVVSGTISGVNSSVAVSGQRNVGGLVGSNGGAITLSASSGAVTGVNADNGGAIGGLAGSNASGASIATSYATGVVTGAREMIGGLVGNNQGALSQSYATGNVTGARSIGGLVGLNGGSIDDAYASGAVGRAVTADPILSMENMGGLVGESTGSVSHVFSSGAVSGDGYASVGAVAGRVSAGSPFSYGFFNYETSLVQTGGGGSSGRSTAQMRQQGSFSDYNFSSVWRMYEGYTTPMLKAFLKPLQVNLAGNATGKVYDGQLAAFLGSIAYVGLIDGDTGVNGSLGYGSNARNVGSYAATGLWSTKYDITMGGTTTFAITPRTLNVQFNGVNKVYDGTTGAALGFGDDRVAGDRLDLSALASFSDKNAGAGKTVFVTNLSLGGADAGNYLLTSTGGTTQATIAQKQLSTWVGSGSGLWSDAANWDGGVVPEGANVLAVDFSNSKGIVTYSAAAGNTILKNLTASAGLLLTGGSLTLGEKAPDSSLLASLEVNGGSLLLNGSLSADRYAQGGGLLSGNGNLLVANSFTQTAGAIRLAGQLAITQAAGDLRFASLAANDVQLSALNGAIGQDGAVLASSLTAQARDGIVLSHAGNQVSSFSASNRAGGGIALNNTSAPGILTLGTLTTGAGNIAIDNTGGVTAGNIDANGGNVSVTARSPVTVNGRIAGNDIALNASTDVVLGDGAQLAAARDISLMAGGDVLVGGNAKIVGGGNFSASAQGNVRFADTAGFTLPAATSMSVLAKTGGITGGSGVRINRQRANVSLQAPNGAVSMADAIFLPVTTIDQPVIIVITNSTLNVIKQADHANAPLAFMLPVKPDDKVPDDKDGAASTGNSTGLTKNDAAKKMYCN